MSEQEAGLRIGLDFDGVCTDCGALKVEAARDLYGVDIPASRFKRELVVGGGLLTTDEYSRLQETIYFEPAWGMRMVALPGALETIGQLQEEGHSLQIVTSRGHAAVALAKAWLVHSDIAIDIVGTNRASKREATAGFDVFLDDDLDKLLEVPHVPNRYLMGHSYNAHEVLPEGVQRVSGWREFHQLVGALALS